MSKSKKGSTPDLSLKDYLAKEKNSPKIIEKKKVQPTLCIKGISNENAVKIYNKRKGNEPIEKKAKIDIDKNCLLVCEKEEGLKTSFLDKNGNVIHLCKRTNSAFVGENEGPTGCMGHMCTEIIENRKNAVPCPINYKRIFKEEKVGKRKVYASYYIFWGTGIYHSKQCLLDTIYVEHEKNLSYQDTKLISSETNLHLMHQLTSPEDPPLKPQKTKSIFQSSLARNEIKESGFSSSGCVIFHPCSEILYR